MQPRDRRTKFRVDFPIFLNQYIDDRHFRVLAHNLSDSGMYVHRAAAGRSSSCEGQVCALEFELPGLGETIWARGELLHGRSEQFAHGSGVRFTGMPRRYARWIRDYCVESRRQALSKLLRRIQTH